MEKEKLQELLKEVEKVRDTVGFDEETANEIINLIKSKMV